MITQETRLNPPRGEANLELALRNKILLDITNKVLGEEPLLLGQVAQLRERLSFTTLQGRKTYGTVASVDAGSQVLPLASGRYGVACASVYVFPLGERFFLEPVSLFEPSGLGRGFKALVDLRRECLLLETALEFLGGGGEVEALLLDGPLTLDQWPRRSLDVKGFLQLRSRLGQLVDLCEELGIPLAGVVKRPSGRQLQRALGLEGSYSDAYLLSLAMSAGEATEPFPLGGGSGLGFAVYSAYLRLSGRWDAPPVRLDVPQWCLDQMGGLSDYCYYYALDSGLPLPIVKADEATKISDGFMAQVYGEALSRVASESGRVSLLTPFWGERSWLT